MLLVVSCHASKAILIVAYAQLPCVRKQYKGSVVDSGCGTTYSFFLYLEAQGLQR